jgi:hypothetical protein
MMTSGQGRTTSLGMVPYGQFTLSMKMFLEKLSETQEKGCGMQDARITIVRKCIAAHAT